MTVVVTDDVSILEERVDVSRYSRGDDRSIKTGSNSRKNPKKSEKSPWYRNVERADMEKKPTQILKVGGGSPVISRKGEVKKALLAGMLEVPYRLDSGADVSVMSEELLEELRAGAVVRTRKCVRPHVVELGDGGLKSITHMALVNISLATNHGPIRLENVQLLVLPGSSRELLVGKPELTRLQLPNLEEALEALAAVRHGRNMPAAGTTQASDSVTLLHEARRMSEDDIAAKI